MRILPNPAKEATNRRKHGLGFSRGGKASQARGRSTTRMIGRSGTSMKVGV